MRSFAFARTNRRAIAMMFVRLSVRLPVWDGRALWSHGARLDSSGHPDTKAYPPIPSRLFPVQPGREVGYGCAN